MEVRGAKNLREVEEAYELAVRIFGPNYFEAKATFSGQRTLESLNSLEDAVLVVSGEKVVGFVRILDRQFYSPIGIVNAGLITSVCTHPDLRGQGWGLKVMEKSLQRSQERGDAFSILFARRDVDGWYPKLGYVGVACHLEMQVHQPIVDDSVLQFTGSIQAGVISSFIDSYAEAYADSFQDLVLSFHRNKDWWQTLESRLEYKVRTEDFINVMLGDTLIGYFMLRRGKVIEAGSLHQYRAEFLAGLVQFCKAVKAETLIFALPSGHWCFESLRKMSHTLVVRYSWEGGHMIRILDKDVFKEMVMSGLGKESYDAVDKLFEKYNVSDHERAQELMLTIVGALPSGQRWQKVENTGFLSGSLLPMLPTWSIVDEI